MTDAPAPTPSFPPRSAPPLQMGLRLQIVLALGGLTLLAFVPLFFAVASLTRATVLDTREQAARALARAIAVHVGEAKRSIAPSALDGALRAHAERSQIEALCLFAPDGHRLGCAGSSPASVETLRAPIEAARTESVRAFRDANGRALEVDTPCDDGTLVARLRLYDETDRAISLARLVALYMSVFALALMVFAYFALTRLIVRPVEQLVAAADRVASGARTLRVPKAGPRELSELGASVQAMAEKLISEEAALLVKIDELTETTRRLTETQAQLVRSERLASVGRLAAGLAHEVGNPLAAIMGLQDLMLEGDLPADAQRDFLLRIRSETERIHAVVRDLLDFARPEGGSAPRAGPLALAEVRAVLDDVVSLVRPQKALQAARIVVEVVGAPRVALSASRLTQVILNLVLNAGAAIASSTRSGGRITLRAWELDPQRVRVEVEDDGGGVDPSLRDRLFEPFATTKDVGEGTGLGLAVCRGLVESAGGEIGFDPTYEGGARFYVVLPAAG